MLAEVTTTTLEPGVTTEPYRWVERDCAIYVYETAYGRCVAFARRRVADRAWEAKLTGPGHLTHVFPHRGRARGKLRRLVAGLVAENGGGGS